MKKKFFELTDVFIHPARAKNGSPIRAYASIVISKSLRIYGIKVLEGNLGLYISWPMYSIKDRKYKPILFLDPVMKIDIQREIIEKYNQVKFTTKVQLESD